MKINTYIIISIIIVFFLGFTLTRLKKHCNKVSCITFPLINKLQPIDVFQQTSTTYKGQYLTSEGIVRIQKNVVDSNNAELLTKSTMIQMESQFENARSPYPDQVSDIITCDKKFKPTPTVFQTKHGLSVTLFSGYLNNRMQYGTCLENEVSYKGFNSLLYCKSHSSWYRIEILIPVNSLQSDEHYINMLESVQC